MPARLLNLRQLHSRKLTWKPQKGPIKTTALLKGYYMGFHVSLGECTVQVGDLCIVLYKIRIPIPSCEEKHHDAVKRNHESMSKLGFLSSVFFVMKVIPQR